MAKRKKLKPAPGAPATAEHPFPETNPAGATNEEWFDLAELWRHPTLLLAAISVVFATLSVMLAYEFRNDMTMGAIREPTGMVLWSAIAVTLFASYWRERSRGRVKSRL